jgi:transcriptional regulator with XRE-family HTH domain
MLMIGHQIAMLREKKGMRQAELAAILNISPSAVGMYEQGRRSPSLSMVIRMAQAFGVTVDYLLTGKDPKDIL